MSGGTAPTPWGAGDLYTLAIAVVVFLLCCLHHRDAIQSRDVHTVDLLTGLMGSSLTAGPLLMVLLDPVNKTLLHILPVDLLAVVMNEARITLWFACFLALINTLMSMLRSRIPAAVRASAG